MTSQVLWFHVCIYPVSPENMVSLCLQKIWCPYNHPQPLPLQSSAVIPELCKERMGYRCPVQACHSQSLILCRLTSCRTVQSSSTERYLRRVKEPLWWCLSTTPDVGRWGQKNPEFKVIFSYMSTVNSRANLAYMRLCLNRNKKQRKKRDKTQTKQEQKQHMLQGTKLKMVQERGGCVLNKCLSLCSSPLDISAQTIRVFLSQVFPL